MKTQTIFVLLFLGNILLQPIMAQTNRVTTTRTTGTTVENGVTMMVTQETTTRYRRTTSQGVPDAKVGLYSRSNTHGSGITTCRNGDGTLP